MSWKNDFSTAAPFSRYLIEGCPKESRFGFTFHVTIVISLIVGMFSTVSMMNELIRRMNEAVGCKRGFGNLCGQFEVVNQGRISMK